MDVRSPRAGYTLIELMVTVVLLSIVIGSIAMVGASGTRLFRTSMSRAEVEAQARRTLARIQEELLSSDHGALDAFPASPLWDSQLTMQQPDTISTTHGTIEWSSSLIQLRYEEGEVDDGVDNDGDGLVDECEVVYVRDVGGPGEREVVLCTGVAEFLEGEDPAVDVDDDNGNGLVDERGLTFERVGDSLFVRLTLATVDSDGVEVLRTLESSVWLRN